MRLAALRLQAHWLLLINVTAALFITLPFAAPVLLASGYTQIATVVYSLYSGVCHQWAFRSYFLFGPQATYGLAELGELVGPGQAFGFLGSPELGYKAGFCQRDVAIYLAVLLAGVAYAGLRHRLGALSVAGYLLLVSPMALDGFTQLFGLRESSVELRTLTGALFGAASVWLVYPRVDLALQIGSRDRPVFAQS